MPDATVTINADTPAIQKLAVDLARQAVIAELEQLAARVPLYDDVTEAVHIAYESGKYFVCSLVQQRLKVLRRSDDVSAVAEPPLSERDQSMDRLEERVEAWILNVRHDNKWLSEVASRVTKLEERAECKEPAQTVNPDPGNAREREWLAGSVELRQLIATALHPWAEDDRNGPARIAAVEDVVAPLLAAKDEEIARLRADLSDVKGECSGMRAELDEVHRIEGERLLKAVDGLDRVIECAMAGEGGLRRDDLIVFDEWQPQLGEMVTGKARRDDDPDPVGKYAGTIKGTARIDVTAQARRRHPAVGSVMSYVDHATLRPVSPEDDQDEGGSVLSSPQHGPAGGAE